MVEVFEAGRLYDALTGERIERGDRIVDTKIRTVGFRSVNLRPTLFIKEDTLVRILEDAGYSVKRDAGDSGNAEGVDGSDVVVGGGAPEVGEVAVGGGDASKRRASRSTKGK